MSQIISIRRALVFLLMLTILVIGAPVAAYAAPVNTAEFKGLLGLYEGKGEHFLIREQNGNLEMLYDSNRGADSLLKTYTLYPLHFKSGSVYQLVCAGPLGSNKGLVTFKRDNQGQGTECVINSKRYVRKFYGPDKGLTFRIKPLLSTDQLRKRAIQAKPPVEKGRFVTPDLVEVIKLDPTIKLDIRYATSNNFMGTALYDQPRAFLQRPAAEAMVRVHRALANYGYGLVIHDSYRPWYVTKMFWDATPDQQKMFVADPSKGSRHNRGGAVDISLYDLKTGKIIEMISGYDEFSIRANPAYSGGTTIERWQRQLLETLMRGEGFTVHPEEWWHFDYQGWEHYPILNLKFSQLN